MQELELIKDYVFAGAITAGYSYYAWRYCGLIRR